MNSAHRFVTLSSVWFGVAVAERQSSGDFLMRVTKARIRGATLVSLPAFADARIELGQSDYALAASFTEDEVTAAIKSTTDYDRAKACIQSWGDVDVILVVNGSHTFTPMLDGSKRLTTLQHEQYLGTVPAFRAGVDYALEHTDADVLCCFHDDLELLDPTWQEQVIRCFERRPACGLAGFGGAIGLGSDDIYKVPYDPMQLARIGFRSNLVDAEVHGIRSLLSERVACLDGFSQIGRREFWLGESTTGRANPIRNPRPLTYLEDHGVIHHFYDGALGALAARAKWETWYIPVRCRHYGGRTAVADQGYQAWAQQQIPGGDQGYWQQSHRVGYQLFRDVLPIRV